MAVTIFLVHLIATLMMAGVIWFVQTVHYPLFAAVGESCFANYSIFHATRTGRLVAPLMLAELATGLLLLRSSLRPWFFTSTDATVGLALLLLIWISTGLVQVPLHNRLSREYDRRAIRLLVGTNWVRTCLWSMRAALLFAAIRQALIRL